MSIWAVIGPALGLVGGVVKTNAEKKATNLAAMEAEKQREFEREMAEKEAARFAMTTQEKRKTYLIMAGVGGGLGLIGIIFLR